MAQASRLCAAGVDRPACTEHGRDARATIRFMERARGEGLHGSFDLQHWTRIGAMNSRGSVLDCGSPLPLWLDGDDG